MDAKTFAAFLRVSQYCGTCFANPLNLFLIYLIITKSSKRVGNYKYLMIYVSVYEIVFSVVAYITEPFIHSFTTRVIVIVKIRESSFDRSTCLLLDCLMCAMYGTSMIVFSVHFLYRYASLSPKYRKLFEGWKLFAWMMVPQVIGFLWMMMYYFVFAPTPEFTEFIRNTLLEELDLNVDDLVYVGPFYFPEDKNGIHNLDWAAFWVMTVVWIMVGCSALIGFVCGYLCYKKIASGLAMSTNSQNARALQKQLFNALVMQSAIPFILMYLPTTIVHFCTFIQQNIGSASRFISYSVAVYPAVDPLPTLLIVSNYRKATKNLLLKCWCCVSGKKRAEACSVRPPTV